MGTDESSALGLPRGLPRPSFVSDFLVLRILELNLTLLKGSRYIYMWLLML